MKFIGGFIAGVVATVIALVIIYVASEPGETDPGLTLFPEKGACITKKELEIFQTIAPTMALAKFDEFPDATLVLLINYEDEYYYDKQRIKIPANKCARQIGIYQYDTKMEVQKTVPVVVIE